MENYYPVFNDASLNLSERWLAIRKFIENWHEITIPQVDSKKEIENIESELGISLPVSFKEYIKLSEQLLITSIDYRNGYKSSGYNHVFRDNFKVVRLEQHNAISLMLQAEGDLYWAVKEEDLKYDDPPVQMYIMDYDSGDEKFIYYKQFSNTLTGFYFRAFL